MGITRIEGEKEQGRTRIEGEKEQKRNDNRRRTRTGSGGGETHLMVNDKF